MDKEYSVEAEVEKEMPKEPPKERFSFFGKDTAKDKAEKGLSKKNLDAGSSKKSVLQKIGIQNLCILLVLGIVLIFLCYQDGIKTKKKQENSVKSAASESLNSNPIYSEKKSESEEYVTKQEEKLKVILSKVDGIGSVEVMITLAESKELVTLKDAPYTHDNVNENDGKGGSRVSDTVTREDETVMSTTDDGATTPYIIKEIQPTIAGVLIIAEGGEDAQLQLEIVEAVEALFDLPVHKIKVMPMKSKQ